MRSRAWVLALAVCSACGSSSWKEQPNPAPGALFVYTIWASGEDDVWLGGTSAWNFDGTGWIEKAPPGPVTNVVDFWGFGPTDLWAIGDSHVFHWDGSAWTEIPPTPGVVFEAMWRIWGAATNDIWIANQDNSRVYHWNGTTWTRTTLQFVMATALWGSSSSDIWVSGTTDLYHYDGATWTRYDGNDAPPTIYGLWGFGPNDMWAAGSFDALSHWDGSRWTPEEDRDGNYNAVWGTASNDIYAVGDHGMVAHFDGSGWSESSELDVRTNFTTVHGSSATNIWATAVNLQEQKALIYRYEP